MVLKPEGIVNERLDRHGITRLVFGGPEKALEPILLTGSREAGRPPMRAQQHPLGHVTAPEFQRLAEYRDGQPAPAKMGRGREAVGTGADDHGVVARTRHGRRRDVHIRCDDDERLRPERDHRARVALISKSRLQSLAALIAGRRSFQST